MSGHRAGASCPTAGRVHHRENRVREGALAFRLHPSGSGARCQAPTRI